MSNQTISEKAKAILDTPLLSYTKLLLESLANDGLFLKRPDGNVTQYYMTEEIHIDNKASATTKTADHLVMENFDLFKKLIRNLYNHLKYGDSEKRQLTEIIEAFDKREVFKMPGLEIPRMKDLLNNGHSLLDDPNIQLDAVKLFNDQRANFPVYISQLLEFYTEQKASEIFQDYSIDKSTAVGTVEIDLIGRKKQGMEFDLLFEVIFRKKPLDTLRDDIVRAADKLSLYNNLNKKDNWLIMVLYADEGTTALDRVHYIFKQHLDESFPDRMIRILLIPIYIGNLHFIDNELKKANEQILSVKTSAFEFRFFNQPIQKDFPEIDDHYYDKTLNLSQSDFKITITPQSPIDHWRLGLKFSTTEIFPQRTVRHSPKYPLFHIEKNKNERILKVSAYDENNNQKFTKPTKMEEYSQEPLLIVISQEGQVTTIDIQDIYGRSMMDKPYTNEGYSFAKLLAWADNRNNFEIKTTIEEQEK